MSAPTVSAVLIALDEAARIGPCLEALDFCAERIVLDGGSLDGTIETARTHGARVETRAFTDFAEQKNHAISLARSEWVLLIDCDETVGPELRQEVLEAIRSDRYDAYEIVRSNRIFGRTLRHGGCGGDVQLRLVRRQKARFVGAVHERIATEGLRVGRLRSALLHDSTRTVKDYMLKLNRYTSLEVREIARRSGTSAAPPPRLGRPLAVWAYRYLGLGGWLDGMEGFLFAVLSGYYEFVRRAKAWEAASLDKRRSA